MRNHTALLYRRIPATHCRPFHTTVRKLLDNSRSSPPETGGRLSPRWLSDLRERAHSDLSAKPAQARRVLDELDRRWLELSAGTEGFLTGPRWTGLDSHQVAWGDMVSTPFGHKAPGRKLMSSPCVQDSMVSFPNALKSLQGAYADSVSRVSPATRPTISPPHMSNPV
jgi:hypothetical protein